MRDYPTRPQRPGSRWRPPHPQLHARTGLWHLTFMLPAALSLLAPIGRHCPCLAGCLLTVEHGGLIMVDGTSREAVFDQATRFLRQLIRRNPPPPTAVPVRVAGPGGQDNWHVVFGADIAFAPGGVEPQFPAREGAE